ncbi:glucan biosynthesis protein [Chromohalobacter canadensis]|uniref:Glucans biosynthesis protein D n=1 Tax=Chromohalobacter canadensis TaxID=141389 RepID=A0ABZ0YGC6_9GAMM|nr:glucan biosynthesis protein D [Chromohalobacter canadensis]WQH10421.1 glucan biosynthesis protein D [Chromohalobacter canadensis]
MMDRRTLLKRSLALAAFYGLPAAPLLAATRDMPEIADGEPSEFSFEWLQRLAKEMANSSYQNNVRELPSTLANMTPQDYNAIGYDPGHSLWHGLDGELDVQFFHVGMGFNQPVRMYALDPDSHQAREIHFDPEIFRYDDADVDVAQLEGEDTLGFAGFRVFKAPSLTERDIVSFLGASYFRAVDDTYQYGISARGLAVNTFAESEDEEFPTYTRFWLETPEPDSTTFTAYALLDSPKVAGAYRFVIHCEAERVVMEIDKHLYPREAIEQLGIAPMTSMFSCGTHQRRMCDTIHPQIHDSDRLTMWRGNGEWVCRPLNNPPKLQYNSFADDAPKGFGLLQTERDFDAYEDVIGNYHERPSLWVEPRNDWGKGEIQMMEIPTTGETMDNVVAFWKPSKAVEPGDSLNFTYRLYWSAQAPVTTDLARIRATRSGMGDFTEGWAPGEHYPEEWARRFAVDYVGGDILRIAKNGPPIMAQLDVSRGKTSDIQIFQVEEFEGIRVIFDWYPTEDSVDPIDMRMVLEGDGDALSETWLYQYFPPPPEQREHPPHPLDA